MKVKYSKNLSALSVTILLASCSTFTPTHQDEQILKTVQALDKLAEYNEEFGSASISGLLIERPDNGFSFDLNRSAADYFSEAKKDQQGAVANFEQSVHFAALGLKGQLNGLAANKDAYLMAQHQLAFDQYKTEFRKYQSNKAAQDRAATKVCNEFQGIYENASPEDKSQTLKDWQNCLAELTLTPPQPPSYPTLNTDFGTPDTSANGAAQSDTNELAPTEAKTFLTKDKEGNYLYAFNGMQPNSETNSIRNREALAIAAGDKIVENIYQLLGNHEQANQFRDKTVIFGAATISVNPGWRTRKNYAAAVSARIRITYDKAARLEVIQRLIKNPKLPIHIRNSLAQSYGIPEDYLEKLTKENSAPKILPIEFSCSPDSYSENSICEENNSPEESIAPLVAAISPLTDTQTLSLADSKRHVTELSLALAGALRDIGREVNGQYFDQYIKSLQRDSKTLSVNSVSNAFSYGGGIFGYQIGPKYKSLDLQDDESDSNNVLEAQSFPVLILMGLDEGDINPKLKYDCKKSNERDNGNTVDTCNWRVYEPQLVIEQQVHWKPITERWYSFGNLFKNFAPIFHHRTSQQDLASRLIELNHEYNQLKDLNKKQNDHSRLQAMLDNQIAIQKFHQSSNSTHSLPIDLIVSQELTGPSANNEFATIMNISPEKIRVIDGKPEIIKIIVAGKHLEKIDWQKVTITPDNSEIAELVTNPTRSGNEDISSYILTLNVNAKSSGGIAFKLPAKDNTKRFLITQPLNIELVTSK